MGCGRGLCLTVQKCSDFQMVVETWLNRVEVSRNHCWLSEFCGSFNFGFCCQPQFGACLRRVEVVLIHGFNWSKSFTAIMGTLSKRLQIYFEWVVNFEAINESHILLSLFNDRSVKQLLNKFKNLPKNKTLMFPLFSTYR